MAKVQVKGTATYVCAVPQPSTLTQAQFEALEWELICCTTNNPSFSQEAEVIEEFCVSGEAVVFTGAAAGAESEMSVMYDDDCEGQAILRGAFEGQPLAFKKELSNGTLTTTPTTIYARALVTGFPDDDGEVNDIVVHSYNLKLVQPPIFVAPEAI